MPASYHYGDRSAGRRDALYSAKRPRILGGEACMWAEYADAGNRGLAHLAAGRGHRRAALVAEGRDRRGLHVRPHGRGQPRAGMDRRRSIAPTTPPMLDRLTGGRPAEPVRVLADASEALGLGPRSRAAKYTTLTPLNRLVDAARPESESVRALEQAAARVAARRGADAGDMKLLREAFSKWAANDARFQAVVEGNVLLAELKPLSKDLSAVGAMGLEALDYLARGRTPAFRLAGAADQRTGPHRPRDHGGAQTQRRGGVGCRAPRQDPHRRPLKSPKMKMFQAVAPPPPLKLRLPFAGPISINRP